MRVRHLIVSVLCGAALSVPVRAESAKQGMPNKYVKPEAAAILAPPSGNLPSQGSPNHPNQQGAPQVPSVKPGAQAPLPAQIPPRIPSPAAVGRPDGDHAGSAAFDEAPVPRETLQPGVLDTLRPEREMMGLDELDAGDARDRGQGVDPKQFGVRPPDKEIDAAAAALRGLTEQLGSNRDKQSDQTRSYGEGIASDPQSLLNAAGSGLAGDRVQQETTTNPDGTTTETVKRHDSSGNVVQFDQITRDSNGTVLRVEQQSSGANGTESHVAVRNPDGSYSHATTGQRHGSYDSAGRNWRSPDWWANVDPDSAYGQGSGQAPGQKKKDPKMVAARDGGVGPGARPDEGGSAAVAPRVQLDDFDDVVNPPPGEATGGGGPAHQGFDPGSTYDGPRDPDAR